MSNERLKAAIVGAGLSPAALADRIGVDTKTVERWISRGTAPYPRHQYATGNALNVDPSTLWPDTQATTTAGELSTSEVVKIYPHRHTVPSDLWHQFFAEARENIDVLVYAGLFLSEEQRFLKHLQEKSPEVEIRILLGDPESPLVAIRGQDEGHGFMGGKIKNAIANYRPVINGGLGDRFRLHSTTLYNSIYRADDEILVNTHVYGVGAYMAPVFHLRRTPGGSLFETYLASLDHTWSGARAMTSDDY